MDTDLTVLRRGAVSRVSLIAIIDEVGRAGLIAIHGHGRDAINGVQPE